MPSLSGVAWRSRTTYLHRESGSENGSGKDDRDDEPSVPDEARSRIVAAVSVDDPVSAGPAPVLRQGIVSQPVNGTGGSITGVEVSLSLSSPGPDAHARIRSRLPGSVGPPRLPVPGPHLLRNST
mgnify:CR=1 FL=1